LFGGLCWAASYVVAFLVGVRTHLPAFPVLATVANITWEFAFGVVWPPDHRARRAMYRAWLLLDTGLLWQAFAWGARDVTSASLRVHFTLALAIALGLAFIAHVLAYRKMGEPRSQAYVINLAMSLGFLHFFFARRMVAGLSVGVAVLKLLGTSCISLSNVVALRPRLTAQPVLLALFLAIFGLDVAYLALVIMARAPWY